MIDFEKVLVVDDDALIRDVVSDMVRRAGFEPVVASSTHDAIGLLAVLKPLAVVLDLHMPEDPGDECCKVIRADKELARVPVIFMTAGAAEENVERACSAGADDFLVKPLREHQLDSKLRAIQAGLRQPLSAQAAAPGPTAKTVLVADDDNFFRTLVGDLLEDAGYKTICAETGLEALSLLFHGRVKPDLCIVDLVMPGIGGLEFIRKLRGTPSLAQLPILVVSGAEQTPKLAEALRDVGVDGVIEKKSWLPAGDIITKVRAALFKHGASRTDGWFPFYRVCEFRSPSDREWLSGIVDNLSATGVAVRTLTPLPVQSVVDIRLTLGAEAPRLIAKATVAWSRQFLPKEGRTSSSGMELRFVEIGAEAQRWVDAFIEKAAVKATEP